MIINIYSKTFRNYPYKVLLARIESRNTQQQHIYIFQWRILLRVCMYIIKFILNWWISSNSVCLLWLLFYPPRSGLRVREFVCSHDFAFVEYSEFEVCDEATLCCDSWFMPCIFFCLPLSIPPSGWIFVSIVKLRIGWFACVSSQACIGFIRTVQLGYRNRFTLSRQRSSQRPKSECCPPVSSPTIHRVDTNLCASYS